MPELTGLAVLLALVLGWTAMRGGRRERVAAALLGAGWAASHMILHAWPERAAGWAVMAAGAAVLVGLARLSWKAPGAWPVWAVGLQAVALAAGLAFQLQPDVSFTAYLRCLDLTAAGALVAVAAGLRRA